jgi:hypothetical protein
MLVPPPQAAMAMSQMLLRVFVRDRGVYRRIVDTTPTNCNIDICHEPLRLPHGNAASACALLVHGHPTGQVYTPIPDAIRSVKSSIAQYVRACWGGDMPVGQTVTFDVYRATRVWTGVDYVTFAPLSHAYTGMYASCAAAVRDMPNDVRTVVTELPPMLRHDLDPVEAFHDMRAAFRRT